LKKIPQKSHIKPIPISIPHSFIKEDSEICVFVKDPQKEYKKQFEEQNVKVSKIIGVSKLRANYKQFEAKRKLCASYDLFLSDDRIIPLLPRLIGRDFFRKKKQPIPIDITKKIGDQILRACNSTYLHFGSGPCSSIRVALTNFSTTQIIENIEAVLQVINLKIPHKWKNIQSLHIKTSESIALPIYNSLPESVVRISTESKAVVEEEPKEQESLVSKRKKKSPETNAIKRRKKI